MKFSKKLLAASVGTALMVGGMQSSHATPAYAFASLTIENLTATIVNDAGADPLADSDPASGVPGPAGLGSLFDLGQNGDGGHFFGGQDFRTTEIEATVNGTTVSTTTTGPTSGGGHDPATACIGVATCLDNRFLPVDSGHGGAESANFAVADLGFQSIASQVAELGGGAAAPAGGGLDTSLDGPLNGGGNGVNLSTKAEVSLVGTATGNANTNTFLEWDFDFNLTGVGDSRIFFEYDAFQQLIAETGQNGDSAIASNTFNITISNGTTNVTTWAANGTEDIGVLFGPLRFNPATLQEASDPFSIGQSLSSNDGSTPAAIGVVDSFSFYTPLLPELDSSGNTIEYLLTFQVGSNVDAESVPEPFSAALLGLGLIGVAGIRRRFKRS